MSSDRDCNVEMHGFPIDDATADRLLSGGLSPQDAPPGFAGVAAMIRAATGPASATELAQQAPIVAAGVAAVASAPIALSAVARRKSMIAKLVSAKVAAAATIAFLGAGTVAAAATGSLPTQTSHASSHAKSGLAIATSHLPGGSAPNGTSTNVGSMSKTTPPSGKGPVGGMTHGNATFGLCTALLAPPDSNANSQATSNKDSSTAFKALIAAHGGSVSAAITFCKGYVVSHHPGKPSTAGKPADTGKPPTAGKPADTSKPSTAGDSSSNALVTTPNAGGSTSAANTASGGASASGTSTASVASHGASSAGSANAAARTSH